ncbi:MAG: hypothetical protein OXE04_03815 [bacterium]|nr:hypothetical protein [bacterium]
MSVYVARTCTEVDFADKGCSSAPLSSFREQSGYVLLGDPGSGETTEFKREQAALGDSAVCISARDFCTFSVSSHPEWQGKTLFIDGLDEMRAGAIDMRSVLDKIRSRLDQLGKPRFRLSCREADWLGNNDLQSLKAVSPDSQITVLRLDPLSGNDVAQFLNAHPELGDVQEFTEEAELRSLHGLLSNPQTLMFLADAVAKGGEWPKSRLATFEMACQQMVAEQNEEHQIGSEAISESNVLDAAGYLSALYLLTDIAGFSSVPNADQSFVTPIHTLQELPNLPNRAHMERALKTKLFVAQDEHGNSPAHRHLAEFLAGRYLAKLIGDGLSATRIVALLIRPEDERVVTTLRGLSAWLAAYSPSARQLLIDTDPVGVGLYGDIGDFSADEKKRVLESLGRFAAIGPLLGYEQRDGHLVGFRDTTAWAFRSLISPHTESAVKELLSNPDYGAENHRIVDFILTLFRSVEKETLQLFDDIGTGIETIVRNPKQSSMSRCLALDVCIRLAIECDTGVASLVNLLGDLQAGTVSDPEDDLRGTLLQHLYPTQITPSQIWKYVLPRNQRYYSGRFSKFWRSQILEQSEAGHLAELLDSLSEDNSKIILALEQAGFRDLPFELLCQGLEAWGDKIEPSRLYNWLDAPKRSQNPRYLQELRYENDSPAWRIKKWLEAHPNIQKLVFLAWIRRHKSDTRRVNYDLQLCNALHWSKPAGDFGVWCLSTALQLADSEQSTADALLLQAYRSLQDPAISEELTIERLQRQTKGNTRLAALLESLCKPSLPRKEELEWQQEEQKRIEDYEAKRRKQQSEWAELVGAHRAELEENRAAPNLLHNLAMAYFAFIVEVDQRASPQERISQFLGDDAELTGVVLTALREAAFRDDLPEVDSTISHRAGLRDFIGSNNERTRHLAEMLRRCSEDQSWGPSIMGQCSDAALLCDMIQMLGRLYGPMLLDGYVTLEVDASYITLSTEQVQNTLSNQNPATICAVFTGY